MIDEKKKENATRVCGSHFIGDNEDEAAQYGFKEGVRWALQEFKKSLWHDATKELPEKGENCIVRISCEYEDCPEDNYEEYNTAVFLGGSSWSEDHFSSEVDVYILRWCRISDLLPKKGGEQC